jgi:hypothetical protein
MRRRHYTSPENISKPSTAEALAAEPVVAEPLTTARRAFYGSIVATKRSRTLFSPIVPMSLPRAVASKPLAPDMSRITFGLSRASTSAGGSRT